MNIIKIQNQLKNAPDDALVGYVQNPTGHVPTYLALSELQRRKEMRSSYQANKPEEKSVAEDLVQEAQPQMSQEGVASLPEGQPMQQAMQPPPEMPMEQMAQGGLAELDTGNMFDENNYASGGIVAFADGGNIPSYAGPEGSYVNPGMYGKPTDRSFLDKLRFGFSSPDEIRKANIGEGMPQNPFMGYMPDANRDPMALQAQIKQLYDQLKNPNADKYAIYQQINELEGRNKNPYKMGGYELTKQDLAPAQPGKPKDEGKGKPAGPNPFDAMLTKEKSLKELSDEYMGILGEDKGAKRLSERLAKMDEKAAKQEQQAPWLALAKAGFEMANTRAEYGKAAETPFASLARGAGAGIKDYAESKEALNKLEEKRFVLDNELSKQARVEQVAALKYGQDSKQHTEEMNKTIQLAKMKDNTERELANMANNTKLFDAMQKGKWDKKDYFKAYNEVAESDAFKQAEKAYVNDKGSWVIGSPQYNQWKDLTIKQLIRQSESPSGTTADAWTNFKKSN
jgi:hypothetical protein